MRDACITMSQTGRLMRMRGAEPGGIDVDQLEGEVGVRSVRADPQIGEDVARHLDVLGKRFGLERQHIGAGLDRQKGRMGPVDLGPQPLVVTAGPHQGLARRYGPTHRRHRVARIEVVADGRGARLGRTPGQPAVGVEIERREPAIRQGPVGLAPPAPAVPQPAFGGFASVAAAHDEQPHRRRPVGGEAGAFQMAVEPHQPLGEQVPGSVGVEGGPGAEFDVACMGRRARAVGPGAHDQAHQSLPALGETNVVVGGRAGIGVVPARQMGHGGRGEPVVGAAR
jgi:hypothetical protein